MLRVATPADAFGDLLARVQLEGVFEDGKTFVDMVPRAPPRQVMEAYARVRPAGRQELAAFVARWFWPLAEARVADRPGKRGLLEYIRALWPSLLRPPINPGPHDSALRLDHPFAVPGDRFREVCYWDSYFTMLGLRLDGHADAAQGLVDNFADLIMHFGHVPNGARTYFTTRSQPPVFYLMAGLTKEDPVDGYVSYLAALEGEHAFWMRGAAYLAPGEANERVVRLPDGTLLNRFWDARDTPRDEAYREDVETAAKSDRPAPEVYRDLRAAAESGWDFSSRWLDDPSRLETIRTTAILPVDLNSLLFGLEEAIASAYARIGDPREGDFAAQAARRRAAIDCHLWDSNEGFYLDLDWQRAARTPRLTAAGLVPLFAGASDEAKAGACARATEAHLLAPGGLLTTAIASGEQWDAPNGWAPLHWMAVIGLRHYGQHGLAGEIAHRWLATVEREFARSGKLVEKYNVVSAEPGGGGEYPVQEGFGWTNGVSRALMDLQASRPGPHAMTLTGNGYARAGME